MVDPSNLLSDRNLEAATTVSLKREPVCFAYLSARAIASPQPIDAINLDLASVDYYGDRASLWTTLDVRSSANNDQPASMLGFDETFLRPFTRALIEASSTRTAYRMTIHHDSEADSRWRVVEYVTGPGMVLAELLISPQDSVVIISARAEDSAEEETLFQLPRTDSFLRAFVKMTCQADIALQETLKHSERLARTRLKG